MANSNNYSMALELYNEWSRGNAARSGLQIKEAFISSCMAGMMKQRDRILAIINSPEADCRFRQALHLTNDLDLTVEAARKHLATMPADLPVPSAASDERARGAATFAAALAPTRAGAAPDAGAASSAETTADDERGRGAASFANARKAGRNA